METSQFRQDEERFRKAFSGWKIALAILIGLGVATWMMVNSLSKEQYIQVPAGTGEYMFKGNLPIHNSDLKNTALFYKQERGDFSLVSVSSTLSEIKWTHQSFFWILAALLCMVGRDFFYMLRIRILTKKKLNWKSSFVVILLWEFASALSPGVVGGAAVAMFILNREKIPLGRSTSIVFITALMDNLFYVLMIPFVFIFIGQSDLFPSQVASSHGVQWVFWMGFTVIFLLCFFLIIGIFFLPAIATKFLSGLFRLPFLKKWQAKAIETGKEMELTSLELRKEKAGFWIRAFLSTLASWSCRYLVINCILNAFINLSLLQNIQLLGKQLVLWLFMLVSPTPGASGIAEYAFGELLASFSASALLISGLAILWRLISYFPYLFIGAFLLPRWMRNTKMK